MHPLTIQQIEVCDVNARAGLISKLGSAQHFEASPELTRFAVDLSNHEKLDLAISDEVYALPSASWLPSNSIVLTVNTKKGTMQFLLKEWPENWVSVQVLECGEICDVGAYKVGSAQIRIANHLIPIRERAENWLCLCAYIVSIINTPRKIDQVNVSVSRQQRRKIQRTYGITVSHFCRIGWEVGVPSQAKASEPCDKDHGIALHYCRRHLRRSTPEAPNSEWINGHFGQGWYIKVADCWKGHFRYGYKFHDYQPRMPDEVVRSKSHVTSGENPGVALSLLKEEACRHAMTQAGSQQFMVG